MPYRDKWYSFHFFAFPIFMLTSKKSFTHKALRRKVFFLIFDNMVLYVVGLRESKALKEDFEKYSVSK